MKKIILLLLLCLICGRIVPIQRDPDIFTWNIHEGVLTISGYGVMTNYDPDSNPAPWYEHKDLITGLDIEPGINVIGDYAFYGLEHITSVFIPGEVIIIGAHAFQGCTSLSYVYISASVEFIGEWTFAYCSNLSEIINASPYPQDIERKSMFTDVQIEDCILRVPYESESEYRKTYGWENFNIVTMYQIGELLWSDHENVLVIRGKGAMEDFLGHVRPPWYQYDNPISVIDVGEGITSIGNWAFAEFGRLVSMSIPNSVTSIGNSAFYGCYELSSVFIPASVIFIDESAFCFCSNLTEIVNENPNPQTIGSSPFMYVNFEECILRVPAASVLLYKNAEGWNNFKNIVPLETRVLKTGKIGSISWVFTEDGVLTFSGTGDISNAIFDDPDLQSIYKNVQHIVMTEGITGTTGYTFTVSPLISISIPASLTSFSIFSLWGCPNLITISVHPDNPKYTSVDGVLFNKDETTLLTYPAGRPGHYEIPSTVVTIGGAFDRCILSSVTIPSSVKNIDGWFWCCPNLTSIFIPSSVTYIAGNCFVGCNAMTSIDVEAGNPNYSSIDGVLFNFDKTTLIAFPTGREGHYDIPQSVKTIGQNAFTGWIKLVTLSIPASVTFIHVNNFGRCHSLTSISVHKDNENYSSIDGVLFTKDKTTLICVPPGRQGIYLIPEPVNVIGPFVFYSCALTSIIFQGSYTFLGNRYFEECGNLKEIVFLNPKPQDISPDLFLDYFFPLLTLRVPSASVSLYKASEVWKKFKTIEGMDVIALDYSALCLLTGTEKTLTATLNERLPETQIDWTSANTAAATIHPTGKVTAIKPGTANITVSAFGNDATCTVTVLEPGNSTIKGTVDNSGTSSMRVNLYVKLPDSETKKGIIGGYVLLATTVPNENGEYEFEDLPEGSYKVDVEMDEYESEMTPAINLSGNETRSDINFEVDGATGTVTPKIATGAVETWHAASLQIYPNPFTDVVHITGVVAVETWRAASLQIFNTAGAIVHTQTIASPDETIHLGHIPPGLYIIRLENGKTIKAIKIQ